MDVREMIFDVFGCRFDGEITEIQKKGLYVSFDGKKAVIGSDSIPAKCRAYTLFAKALSEGKDSFEISQEPSFETLGVMLDMSRGGVMRVESVKKYLRRMASLGMNMLMLYTEDTYEVEEYPYLGYQRGRYTLRELQEIDDYADQLGIEMIPCIQTFGHMEKFLRYGVNASLRDTNRVLLAGEEETYRFIDACIAAMRKAFRSKRIHIGCDETNGMGTGRYLALHGDRDRLDLFTEHLTRVCEICEKYGFRPMMWSDMYFAYSAGNRKGDDPEVNIPQRILDIMPDADMAFWAYDDRGYEYYRCNMEKHRKLKGATAYAGAVWTWEGMVPNYTLSYRAMLPALKACIDEDADTVIATLWSNDGCEASHFLAIPQLAIFSEYCWKGASCTEEDIQEMWEFTTGFTRELGDAVSAFFFGYDGAVMAGKAVLWSDPLINLLCYDYDLARAEKYLEEAMPVFEKYENTEYFKILFAVTLGKCRLHMHLRDRYKAGDKAWLKDYAEHDLLQLIDDFEKLYEIHCRMWRQDYKGNGLEVIMLRYAGAIERLRYTVEVIHKYLAGELEQIEELEPELIQGKREKYLKANTFMETLW